MTWSKLIRFTKQHKACTCTQLSALQNSRAECLECVSDLLTPKVSKSTDPSDRNLPLSGPLTQLEGNQIIVCNDYMLTALLPDHIITLMSILQ